MTTIGHETEELEFKKRLESLLNLVLFVFCSFFVLFWRAMRSSLAVGGHPTNATPLRLVGLHSFNVFCLPKTNKLPLGNFFPNSRSSIGCFPPKKGQSLLLRPFLARHEELESPTFGSVDQRSIQLS